MWRMLTFCAVAGVLWLVAHAISLASRRYRLTIRFSVMTAFTVVWLFLLWQLTRWQHPEEDVIVYCILPWWAAIVAGNIVEGWRRQHAEHSTGG